MHITEQVCQIFAENKMFWQLKSILKLPFLYKIEIHMPNTGINLKG
jgi:hypothetical protein